MAKVSLRAYNREIETMIDRGQLDEAIAHCHHIFKTFPKHLETYRLLGKAYLEYKRYGDAVDVFTRALVAAPNDFVANVGLSIIRDEENKIDDAIWHMERAFEVQPSNSAIQGELQRLYGRRDGVVPPRVRMTKGALAHMYVQGELYPQAISEIKNVLKEDAGRSDMQALLARAYFKSGQKNEAVEVSSALLRRYPYCLDPNRVLAEILGAEKPENAKAYRQRVIELDPYAAHVNGSLFQAGDTPDMAVMLDRLEWNGQPVDGQAEWRDSRSISLEGERSRDEQPDWLRAASRDTTPTVRPVPQPAPVIETSLPPALPADEIPDFLRAAGWGESTGAFDESKSALDAEMPAVPADSSLAQGDLPDWVKAMAPKQEAQPADEEEMPDWINKIGPASVAAASATTSQPADSDWLGAFGQPAQPADEQPDWLRGLGGEVPQAAPPASSQQPDWLKGLGGETPAAPKADDLGWLNELGSQPAASDTDFLADLISQSPESSAPTLPPASLTFEQVQQRAGGVEDLGKSQSEIDDSLAWLEGLAAKQGATEGLLTKPEERLEQEPDWIKQVKGEPVQPVAVPPTPPANIEDLGKSQSEIDDSLAWLEGLAAKQGATEGLLTKPEERLEQEPDWVKKVKSSTGPLAEQKMPEPVQPVSPPPANIEDLGKSQSEIDDSLAWLEGLAAKQGATEGLLTKPEERLEQEPDWIQRAKSLPPTPAQEEPVSAGDTATWLKSLDDEESDLEPDFKEDETAIWLKSLDEKPAEPAQPAGDELPAWMRAVEEEKPVAAEPVIPAEEAPAPAWTQPVEESKPEAESLPGWLSSLDKEEEELAIAMPGAKDDLPAWLRDETGEVVAEPVKIEPTRPTDWKPADMKREEIPAPPPPVEEARPEPMPAPVREPAPKPAEPKPVRKPKPAEPKPEYREPVTIRGTGMLSMPVDPILGSARTELTRSNIPGALETYGKLIKKGRFLDEVIFDLREALYRYPVEVSIWQSLGDAYMRANRLQDALDAYTKAEELLR